MGPPIEQEFGYHANLPSLIELLPTFDEMRSVKPKTFQVLKWQAEVGARLWIKGQRQL